MSDKKKGVYVDNNASTEISQDVASVIMDLVLHNLYGNPSSPHEMGTKLRTIIDASRYGVAESLGCSSEEIIFTSGGTESNNMAMRGVYDPALDNKNSIVISAVEHSSVLNTAKELAGDERLRLIPVDKDGLLDFDWVNRLLTDDVSIISVMLANNETGVIFPIKDLVKIAHKRGILVHCDAVQAYGKIPINVRNLGVDLLSISGHKAHALPGVGALYVRKGIKIHPYLTGGGHEFGLRSGTENYIGIATLGTVANEITNRKGKIMEPGLRDAFERGLIKRISNITINGSASDRLPNTSSVTFEGVHAASMLTALAEQGIYASASSACSSGSMKPSRILLAMGLSEEQALSTIRFSFSSLSKIMDVALSIEACVKAVSTLRQSSEST